MLQAVKADRWRFHRKGESARTALCDTVADLTSFTKQCFPEGSEEALKAAQQYAESEVAKLLRTKGDAEKQLPRTKDELTASVKEFCKGFCDEVG